MDNVNSLTDQELRTALKRYNVTAGPITDSTRNLYRKKLSSIIEENESEPLATAKGSQTKGGTIEEEEYEDTSDEDYDVREEELDEEEEEEFDDDEEEDDLINDLQEDDVTSSRINTTRSGDLSQSGEPGAAAANRISGGILISLVSFFVVIFSFYLLSSTNHKLLEPLKPFKNITRQLLVLAALSPIGYIAYKVLRYYRLRRHEENKHVCELVSGALELLQSPENPKGLMPILHIRDTLLTPAERNTTKTLRLWLKAVKFIEERESRVKVEIVNIDGEDFRAWKWIGSRKL